MDAKSVQFPVLRKIANFVVRFDGANFKMIYDKNILQNYAGDRQY